MDKLCYYYYMNPTDPPVVTGERVRRHKRAINSFKAKADSRRNLSEKFADWMTDCFGTVTFLSLNAIWFVIWITINTGLIPGLEAFDPFPFGLLTMIVSLEAIFLAIIVLISQNRAAKVAEFREEIDLYINTVAEEEITKMIKLQAILLEKNGINVNDDPELQDMLSPMSSSEIERRLEAQLHMSKNKKPNQSSK